MPIIQSAKKALRQNITRRRRNIERKEAIKSLVKKVRKLIALQKKDEAAGLIPQLYKAIDKAVKTGVMKKNTAARRKSRFAKLTHETSKPPPAAKLAKGG